MSAVVSVTRRRSPLAISAKVGKTSMSKRVTWPVGTGVFDCFVNGW